LQLGPDGAQGRVVFQQRLVNLRQPFEDGGVGGQTPEQIYEPEPDE